MDREMQILKEKVSEMGVTKVAHCLGYARSSVSLAVNGKYNGDLTNLLTRVREVFAGDVVFCPVLGEIALKDCSDNKKRPFSNTNPLRLRLWKACQNCENKNNPNSTACASLGGQAG